MAPLRHPGLSQLSQPTCPCPTAPIPTVSWKVIDFHEGESSSSSQADSLTPPAAVCTEQLVNKHCVYSSGDWAPETQVLVTWCLGRAAIWLSSLCVLTC